MGREHKRIIVKYKNEAEYYPSQGTSKPLTKGDRRVKTIVTNDDYVVIANIDVKITVYKDGRFEAERHDNTKTLKI